MPKLVFTDTRFAGREYPFTREKTVVGRADDNLLVIHDPSVSSHHCEIIVNGQEVIVHDLDSRNGTFVNGQRLQGQQTQIKSGGLIRFGTVQARVEIEPDNPRDDATEITAVYSHGRAMDAARRSATSTPTPNPAMKLDPASAADSGEQTILMPVTSERPAGGTPPVADKAARATEHVERGGSGRWIGLVTAVVAIAAVLIWFLWLRK